MKTISVTQKHIDEGIRFSGSSCPIALALKEEYNYAYVSYDYATICERPNSSMYGCTKRMKQFIDKFDQNKEVKPFKFRLKG